jgi:hypothetical protein
MAVFSRILTVDVPQTLACEEDRKNPEFEITFTADGDIPFPQVILHVGGGTQHLIKGEAIGRAPGGPSAEATYLARVPSGLLGPGKITVQVEGCRIAEIEHAGDDDWLKAFATLTLAAAPERPRPAAAADPNAQRICFGIHKHMHQPYYNTTDPNFWDGEKDGIFGSRGGNYTHFIPDAVRQYIDGGLAHAGLSTSWSGSLIEQLDRCARDGLCGGRFQGWNEALRAIGGQKTELGNPRVDFSAFGFFHPLMALIPERNIVKQIEWHRRIVRDAFGVDASTILFPPETAFHVRMIPALKAAGVTAVIYDSIHRFRACKDYPYAGMQEGMLPPNPAEQANPAVDDWLQLHNVWAGSKISSFSPSHALRSVAL